MPKRNRSNELRKTTGYATPAPAAAESEQARSARLFADSIRQHAAADQVERDRKSAAASKQVRHEDLIAAKEAAAGVLRRLRDSGRPRQQMVDAEAAYRIALATLQEFETGERPHWAPTPVPVDEPQSVDEPTPVDEPTSVPDD